MKQLFIIISILLFDFTIAEVWNLEEIIVCPKQCFCQNTHFADLSVSRWINMMNSGQHYDSNNNKEDNLVNNNEAWYEGDESYLSNPIIKQATCILQKNINHKLLFEQLPHDIQSLVILYSEVGINLTVPTSYFKPLNQLTTLEIRGSDNQTLKLLIDEPLDFLVNANFESIKLESSELFKRPKNPIHPSESFDYVPNSEKMATYNLSLEIIEDEFEILPYEIYVMEMKKSRMPNFYNWKNLEILRIYNCKLEELHWEMFDGLSELQHLSLEKNNIKLIPAFALYGALHIKTLSLAYNNIHDLNYRALAGLLDLEVLNLSYNNLTKLSELTFPPFPKLEIIDFRHNPIHYIFPATFGIMNNTATLYLGSEDMTLELSNNKPFEFLNLLKQLVITNVSIEILNQNVFKNLKHIEIVRMHGFIGKIDFDAFVDLKELKEFNSSYCGIRDISMDAFIGSVKLQIIDLSNNKLSYIPPGIFDDQVNIKEIYLQNNKLKFLPSNFFTNPTLKLIRLTGNPWKCSCDMTFWDKKITNQLRTSNHEECIKDYQSEKVISCKKVKKYMFVNKLSPRCKNFKNRSLYYVLRHDFQCKNQKELKKRLLKTVNSNEREKKSRRKIKLRPKFETKHEIDNKMLRKIKWEKNLKKKTSMEEKDHHINSLKYLSEHNNYQYDNTVPIEEKDLDLFNVI